MTPVSINLSTLVGIVINVASPAQALSNYNSGVAMIQGINPTSNSWRVCGANGQASPTIAAAGYGAVQGNQSNPTGRLGDVTPAMLLQLENQVMQQTIYQYRI